MFWLYYITFLKINAVDYLINCIIISEFSTVKHYISALLKNVKNEKVIVVVILKHYFTMQYTQKWLQHWSQTFPISGLCLSFLCFTQVRE